ncbi:MAG TPA: dTDP-glucose 4,6-dehydratase [Anaerolineaceae bacterium]
MKIVLVTGGAGFIGSNFIHYLLKTEPKVKVINLDALTYAGNPANLVGLPDESRHTFVHGNICDRALVDSLFHRYGIDTVVHFAAETHVDRSILDPAQFVQTNVVGTFTLLEAARQAWVLDKTVPLGEARFQHVSTDEVFGTLAPGDPPFDENTPYAPNSVYSASKASSDHLVRAYERTFGLPVTITNCSNNYGPYQFPEKLIPLMILNGVTGRPLPVYGDGMQVRDWLYVGDHCEAIYQVLKRGRLGQTYCVGGDNQPPNIEIVETICDILDELLPGNPPNSHRSLITHVVDRPGHDRRYDINIQKIKDELGWQPQRTLRDGLLATVQWYLSHPEWVSSISQRSDFKTWMEHNYAQRGGSA